MKDEAKGTNRLQPKNDIEKTPRAVAIPSDFYPTTDALKQTLQEVERDEAEALSVLCSLLESVETSRNFKALAPIRDVVKEWQNRPPRGIVTDLKRIGETLKCPARDNT